MKKIISILISVLISVNIYAQICPGIPNTYGDSKAREYYSCYENVGILSTLKRVTADSMTIANYLKITSLSNGLLKNVSGVVTTATVGTDYVTGSSTNIFTNKSGSNLQWTNDANYLTGNQSITFTGDVSGSGTTAITTTIGAGKVTNAMLNGSIAYSKLSLTGSIISGDIVSLVWSKLTSTPTTLSGYGITDALVTTNNLSDLNSPSSARTNLGLGTLATQSGTFPQTTVSGNAGTATKLATGRTISTTGDVTYTSPSFDGSANVSAAATVAFVNGYTLYDARYAPISGGTVTLAGDASGPSGSNTVTKINNTSLAGLSTGILKNTTTTGVPSIAIAADFPTLNQSTTGNANTATALQTPQNINGTPFNGTAPITVTAVPSGSAGGSLSGTYPNPTVATNANLTGPITSSGNATSIASQTGTGTRFVVDNTPTLITPNIGVATATSVNKVTITQPATGATLTLADGSTLQVSGAFLTQLISSAATTATLPSGTYTIAKSTDVQVFTGATATWTKPTGAKSVFVLIIGCGGGGGSGRKSASLTLATGGGGGSAGSSGFGTFDASFLTSTVSVQVGQGGTGGASTTTNSTDGSVGQSNTFYTNTLFGNYLQCGRGGPGSAGTALGAATGGTAPSGFFNGVAGGASSATGGIGSNGGNSLQFGGAPGGAGGGITTIAAASAGGNGGTNGSGGIAGGSGGAVNTNGSNGQVFGYLGTGGGGGGASTTTNAGAGGNGASYGGGGGGGGAALDGVGNSGAGGNGAPGIVVVITNF